MTALVGVLVNVGVIGDGVYLSLIENGECGNAATQIERSAGSARQIRDIKINPGGIVVVDIDHIEVIGEAAIAGANHVLQISHCSAGSPLRVAISSGDGR